MKAFLLFSLLLFGDFFCPPQSGFFDLLPARAWAKKTLSPEKIEEIKKSIAKNSGSSLKLRLRLARHYKGTGEYDKVIDYLRPIIDSLDVSGMKLLSYAFSQKNDHLQEIRLLENLVLKDKNDYASYSRLGQAYFNINNQENSLKNFQKAISLNKRYRPAYDGLLKSLKKLGKRYEYRITLIDMAKIFRRAPSILNLLCQAYYEDGFLNDARTVCQEAFTQSPNNADNHVYFGLTFEASNQSKRAIAIVQKAAKQYPKSEFAQYKAAELHEANKNILAAYKYYRRGTKADKNSSRSWLGLARLAFDSHNYKESLEAFQKACELDRAQTIRAFQKASTQLKLKNDMEWKNKYHNASTKCRYQRAK